MSCVITCKPSFRLSLPVRNVRPQVNDIIYPRRARRTHKTRRRRLSGLIFASRVWPGVPESCRILWRAMIYIGISGWTYGPWQGKFYPPGLSHKRELEYASRQFNSIEINGSFYSLQRPSSYQMWYEQTPDDFVFSAKGGRFITHMLRLRNVETALANFFASGVLCLKEKLGPILWQ